MENFEEVYLLSFSILQLDINLEVSKVVLLINFRWLIISENKLLQIGGVETGSMNVQYIQGIYKRVSSRSRVYGSLVIPN